MSVLYASGSSSDSTLCRGTVSERAARARNSGGLFRHWNFFWVGGSGQRDLPYRRAGAGAGLHLQRGAGAEFRRSAGDWARGTDARTELGVLFVRCGISAGRADDDAIARNAGEEAGVTVRLPQTVASEGPRRKRTAGWDSRARIGNRRVPTSSFLRFAVSHTFCMVSLFVTIVKVDGESIEAETGRFTRWDRLRPILDFLRRAPAAAQ